jgi:hypothetical protein
MDDLLGAIEDAKTSDADGSGNFACKIAPEAVNELAEIKAKARREGKKFSNVKFTERAIHALYEQYVDMV